MTRTLPCLFALLLPATLAAAETVAPPSGYAAAKRRADHDEAALPAALADAMRQAQSAELDEGVAACAMPQADTRAFVIVVELGADGRIAASWREGDTPLAVCVEKFLRGRPLPAPPQAPLYLSYELSFVP